MAQINFPSLEFDLLLGKLMVKHDIPFKDIKMDKFKPGDRVVCIEDCDEDGSTHPNDLKRCLTVGDEVEIHQVYPESGEKGYVTYLCKHGDILYLLENKIQLKSKQVAVLSECSCNILTIMNMGCKCGFLEKERLENVSR